MSLLRMHIERGGGVIAGPQGLGILIGNDPKQCPAGWIFVDIELARDWTPEEEETYSKMLNKVRWGKELDQEVMDALNSCRNNWPEKESTPSAPKPQQQQKKNKQPMTWKV